MSSEFYPPKPGTLERLEEKFYRIASERGSLPKVTYRLTRRTEPLDPEFKKRVLERYHRYLDAARRRGKDLRRQCQRQPYYMLALRYERSTRESRKADYAKVKKTMNQKRYYYDMMNRRIKERLKGVQ